MKSSRKKFFSWVMALAAIVTITLHPYIDRSVASASTRIPLNLLPVGAVGSSTVDIGAARHAIRPNLSGAFRTQCLYSHMNYDDPIVFPNQVGATHLHTFFGNTQTDANSTYQSLSTSGNSTCKGGIANRSAYWIPTLLDRNGQPVVPDTMFFYYKSASPETVKDIPNGLRLLVGDSKAQSGQEPKTIRWECRTTTSPTQVLARVNYIPSCAQGNTLRLAIIFPTCWDGFNLDSPNHQDHVSDSVKGKCPTSHPVQLPNTSINVVWNLNKVSTQGWRLSSDMYPSNLPGGYSTHAGWFEAWQPDIRKTWFSTCLPAKRECGVGLLGNNKALYFK